MTGTSLDTFFWIILCVDFPVAAVTNGHNLDGLNNSSVVPHSSRD